MEREEIKLLEQAFADGYRKAEDKLGFMRLSGIPMELAPDGRPAGKLVRVKVSDNFIVGSAGPGFGSRDPVYQPFPGEMVTSETALEFLFVHADGSETYTLAQLLAIRDRREPEKS
jgi:hypothetical protein